MQLVRDIMRYNLGAVTQDVSLREAAELMKLRHTGMIPVGDAGRMIGIVTDRDIAMGVVAEGLDPNRTPVGLVMAESIIAIEDDRDLVEAMQLMEHNKVHRLIVLDRTTQAMMGVVTLGDIVNQVDHLEDLGPLPHDGPDPADTME